MWSPTEQGLKLIKLHPDEALITMNDDAMKIVAKNLVRYRTARKMTQGELASAAKLSRVAYRNIEMGEAVPRSSTLQALADALQVSLEDLFEERTIPEQVRFRSLKKLYNRESILEDVARWIDDFRFLEELLDERRPWKLGKLASRVAHGPERPIQLATLVREKLKLTAKEPIRDLCGLVESNGVKVRAMSVASDAFFGLSIGNADGGPAIVVNTWERISVERWIFTVAHELGHLVLHLDDYDVQETAEPKQQEIEANLFASYFLMPHELFNSEWNDACGLSLIDRVLKVKRICRVSYKTVLYRIAQQRQQANLWARFQGEWKHRHGRTLLKSDEPDALSPDSFAPESLRSQEPDTLTKSDFAEDRLSKLTCMAVVQHKISTARAAEILRISPPEMDHLAETWKVLN